MTLAELRQAVRDDLDEPSAAFWSDVLLDRYINRSCKWVWAQILQLDEEYGEATATGTYPGNARDALLRTLIGTDSEPEAFVGVWDITDDVQQGVQLDHTTIGQAEALYGGLDASAGALGPAYFLSGNEGGARTFAYRPIPGSARTLRFVYKAGANTLVRDKDVPSVPVAFHEAIVLRTVLLAKLREESPVADVRAELMSVVRTALMSLDGRHADQDTRVAVSDPDFYDAYT